ncbi:leucyl aminopeptidase family protein [Sphingomonas sp. NSE70-1]|uniref:Leucyl aminopeptidase family protein n=1 Tax=Sphingomonas caseinilyticus TaxID=2908205 RepID=A0ABT0RSQ5_9SPHN|nr:leucyl aminopeptidase family protein [Sphingomonas caseinilyticus]MCL6697949.1 leucyl aminopeptidase family protein [Sphingomonas caseinilyticus]
MTVFADLLQADRGGAAHAIHLVDKAGFADWAKKQSAERRTLLEAARYQGKTAFQFAILPGSQGQAWEVVSTVANVAELSPWCLAKLAEALPEGTYRLAEGDPGPAMLGWLLGQHRFKDYKSKSEDDRGPRVLLTKEAAGIEPAVRLAEATALARDLVDTPAADLGPAELEAATRSLAKQFGAKVDVTSGDALEQGYPMIAAVGQGAVRERAPRLIELRWGKESAPRIAIVGKGVCFDSGGLDIKSTAGMRLMKKDMGGAAHALALAKLVMAENLPVHLHLLIPAVENAVSAAAFRPGDVISSRKGLKIEIDNTDAEGRLVLGDALARAAEEKPELVLDFATLTGAARIALGPDLPAMFANDEELAADLESAARQVSDPIWRMPLWDGYDEMLKSDLADLSNSADSSMAGSVTAALFLRRFAPEGTPWAHFDTYAWRPSAKPGRPKGGDALGLRAAFAMLAHRYGR